MLAITMKHLALFATLAAVFTLSFSLFPQISAGEEPDAAICYRGSSGFVIAPPPHWVNLPAAAAEYGACVIYVPEGYDFVNSPVLIYPNMAAAPAATDPALAQAEALLAEMRALPGGEDITLADGGEFRADSGLHYKLYYFDNGPNSNRFELVAVHTAGEHQLLLVLSSLTAEGRTASLQDFMSVLFDVFPIEVTEELKSGGR